MGVMDGRGDRQHLPLAACYVVLQRGSVAQWTSRGGASQSVQALTQLCPSNLWDDLWKSWNSSVALFFFFFFNHP